MAENITRSLIVCTAPFVLLPAAIGVYILFRYHTSPIAQLAGVLTIKPVIATPLWALVVSTVLADSDSGIFQPAYWLSLLPGLGLTGLILLAFKSLLAKPNYRRSFVILLLLDSARWFNTFLYYLPWTGTTPLNGYGIFIGLAMPSVYAIVALSIAREHHKLRRDVFQAV